MNLPARWTSVEMILRDVVYISYRVPASLVRSWVPGHLSPAVVGDDQAFITVMMFQVERARAARLPSPQTTYHQINVMTYVQEPQSGETAIYFLRKGATKPGVVRAMRWLRMPVDPIEVQISAQRDHRDHYAFYKARGSWNGEFHVHVRQVAPRLESLPPFESGQDAVIYLTDPLIGYYGGGRSTYRLESWHPRAQPRVGVVESLALPFLEGIVGKEVAQAAPAVVLLAPRHHYLIHLPPRRSA